MRVSHMVSTVAAPAVVAAASLVGVLAHRRASGRFQRHIEDSKRELVLTPAVRHVRQDLPARIEAFARSCTGVEGDRVDGSPATWRMDQVGVMRIAADGPWLPFTAEQTIALGRPGFVWFAKMSGPGPFHTKVLDSFVADRGLLEARAMGSVPLVRSLGPRVDVAEATRYLGELPWTPLAMLCNRLLHWKQLADDVYEVTLHTGSGPASVRLHLRNGDVTVAEADARMWAPGRYLPWRCIFGDYVRFDGVRVPLGGEVGWIEDGRWRPYWRGSVLTGSYAYRRSSLPQFSSSNRCD